MQSLRAVTRVSTQLSCRNFSSSLRAQTYKIGAIPGDGIGKEIMPAAIEVVKALETDVEFIPLEAGFELFQKTGTALPQETIDTLKNDCQSALFGAVSSPSHKVEGYSSPIVALRKHLDLYGNVRPIVSSPVAGSREGVDCVIIRENTECLYVKQERIETLPDGNKRAVADRVITEKASKRIGKLAYQIALQRSANKERPGLVTIVHKSNVLSVTDGLFRETVLGVSKESELQTIATEEQLVDSMVYRLFRDPENFDVVVCPNMYGDIVSDGAAAIVGGLGIVPSSNMGDSFVLGEPIHGSAPDICGKGIANPVAMIRCAALVLENLGEGKRAQAIEQAVKQSIIDGNTTPDLGGKLSTSEVTKVISDAAVKIFKSL